ncbi:MAG: DUF952 domain-containing protein [Planctomycetes bacterium]|nr:DUF952 domain-containing protein [Planctomycetota bacterium]MCB9872177.1 DUF952 domain-containing protein [Planctomycetota bacterium]
MLVYKVLRRAEWLEFESAGVTIGAAIDRTDGYIHLSTAEQVEETVARHFAGERDLRLLAIDADRLGSALRWEPSRGGALFPHLYAPLHLAGVSWVKSLPFDGHTHEFPDLADPN